MPHVLPDPRANARIYGQDLPEFAIAVYDPWWWPVLALGVDTINVGQFITHRGPLAIISRPQASRGLRSKDMDAISSILKADGRPSFDAYSSPIADGKVVGLVDVIGFMDDATAEGLWFSGPFALRVRNPVLMPFKYSPNMVPSDGLIPIEKPKRMEIWEGLSALVHGASPGRGRL